MKIIDVAVEMGIYLPPIEHSYWNRSVINPSITLFCIFCNQGKQSASQKLSSLTLTVVHLGDHLAQFVFYILFLISSLIYMAHQNRGANPQDQRSRI